MKCILFFLIIYFINWIFIELKNDWNFKILKKELLILVFYCYKEYDICIIKYMCDVIVYYRCKCRYKMISRWNLF